MFVRPRSIAQDFALSLLTALAMAIVGRLFTALAESLGAKCATSQWMDDTLTGVVAGIATFIALRGLARHRAAAIKRLRDIGEMNHHVRNALEVIRSSHFAPDGDKRMQIITEASDRIESALREFNV